MAAQFLPTLTGNWGSRFLNRKTVMADAEATSACLIFGAFATNTLRIRWTLSTTLIRLAGALLRCFSLLERQHSENSSHGLPLGTATNTCGSLTLRPGTRTTYRFLKLKVLLS